MISVVKQVLQDKLMDNEKRIGFIDLAKGIAVLSMVLCHVGCPYVVRAWIYSFHMPIFFIISGLLVSNKKYLIGRFLKQTF